MPTLGTPLSPSATRVLMLGAGELGKEVVIELQRLGVRGDRGRPLRRTRRRCRWRIAPTCSTCSTPPALRELVLRERPALIVPEIEAIATPALIELEREGFRVIPTARAARLTMDREGIRRLAAEELGLATSPYRFADPTRSSTGTPSPTLGFPCVVKPVMSSSGKGQSLVKRPRTFERAWDYAQHGGRAGPAASSSRASSTSTTRSRCSRSGTPAARASARRSATCRSTATTASPGNRSR